ncbi:hypothetical protein [Neisseria lactamica]|uniref:hypothetical protein n=1 Tax=Neisseria lactamica TaxID=486 RepID=UPI0002E7919E|nr:hypothetical protein [Neisseria lactamica]
MPSETFRRHLFQAAFDMVSIPSSAGRKKDLEFFFKGCPFPPAMDGCRLKAEWGGSFCKGDPHPPEFADRVEEEG